MNRRTLIGKGAGAAAAVLLGLSGSNTTPSRAVTYRSCKMELEKKADKLFYRMIADIENKHGKQVRISTEWITSTMDELKHVAANRSLREYLVDMHRQQMQEMADAMMA